MVGATLAAGVGLVWMEIPSAWVPSLSVNEERCSSEARSPDEILGRAVERSDAELVL